MTPMDLAALVAAVVALVAALIARHHAKRAATFHRAALSSAGRAAASALRADERRGGEHLVEVRRQIAEATGGDPDAAPYLAGAVDAALVQDPAAEVWRWCLNEEQHRSHPVAGGQRCPGLWSENVQPGAGGLAVTPWMLDLHADAQADRERTLDASRQILAEHAPWSVWKWCLKTEHHGQHPTPGGKMCPGVLGPDIRSTLPGRPV